MAGRRTKLTPKVQDKILEGVRIGLTFEVAAGAAGVDRSTFYRWMARARAERERLREKGARPHKSEQPYCDLCDSLEEAEDDGEKMMVAQVRSSGASGSKWILTRRHPKRWAATNKQVISGPGGGPIEIKGYASLADPDMWPDEDNGEKGKD